MIPTPLDKANELYDKFSEHTIYWDCYNDCPIDEPHTKLAALIAVDEIYNITPLKYGRYEGEDFPEGFYSFWEDVKEELNKL